MSTFIVISQGKFDWLQLTLNNLKVDCVVPENIHTPPPRPHIRDRIFHRGGGVNLPNFPVGRGGGHHREIFPEGSCDARRVTKKKQKITTTIYLRRYKM